LQVLYCVDDGGGAYVLWAEAATVCFDTSHLVAFIVAAVLLIAYVIGFPIYCL
jgi:hypothetical protein